MQGLSEKIKNINESITINYHQKKINESNVDLYLGNCPIILIVQIILNLD